MTEAADSPGDRMRFNWLRTRAQFLIVAAAIAATLGTLLALGARWWWVADLFSHFRCHYSVVLAVGTAFCGITRHWWLAAIFGICAAFNMALIVPLYLPAEIRAAGGRSVRVMLANVHVRNHDHERFLQLVRDESPDVIVVLEVGSAWQKALDDLAAEYPYRVSRPREDAFGIAFLSRLRADHAEVREIGPAEVPSIVAHIDCGENVALELVGTHPLPPVSAENVALRNEQLRDIGRLAGSLQRPTVLVGDLNTTSWSPIWRDLLVASGLRDSRLGCGVQPTWPGNSMIGIPIDHVLVSSNVVVDERKIGPHIGSDHLPVIVELRVLPTMNANKPAIIRNLR